MKRAHLPQASPLFVVTALAALTATGSAQNLLPTQGIVVASSNDPVPDSSGTPIPGYSFTSGTAFDTPYVDDSGRVFFRGAFNDGNADAWDSGAYFWGTSRADLKMKLRGGDQAPSLGTGVLLRDGGGLSVSINLNPQVASNGRVLWGSGLWDSVGTNGITSANDEAMFGGLIDGPQSILVQQGDPLPPPALAGTTFAQAFGSPNVQTMGMNANGLIFFLGTTTGGDTSTTSGSNNQQGIWMGLPGAYEQVARRSNPVSGLPGAIAVDTATTLGSVLQINPAGQLFYEIALSTTQGAPAATPANDHAYMVHTPGAGSVKLVREGDDAPGTFNGSSFATFNTPVLATNDNWTAALTTAAWTRSGKTIFTSTLRGGDVVGTQNDTAIFVGGVGSLSLAVRKGDPAPGTDGTFDALSTARTMLNDAGEICFLSTITGGTVTTANNSGIWCGFPGALQLVVRKGDVMPGTGGSTAGTFSGTSTYFNDTNRVLFTTLLSGGTVTGSSWWTWSANTGLQPVLFNGDTIEVQPGVFKTANGSLSGLVYNNGDGATRHWTNTGELVVNVSLTDNSRVIMRLRLVPETQSASFCSGDGTATACPCGNSGAAGHGCANQAFPGGAWLSSAGFASVTPALDSLTLTAHDVPGPGLFFQGDGQFAGGNGIAFGDGLLCAGGTILRLGVVFPTAGAATYPGGLTPNPIHVGGGPLSPGNVRHYQCWYRDAAAFCTAATYNLTQGLTLTWQS